MIVNNRPDGEEPGQPLGADDRGRGRSGWASHIAPIPIMRGIGPADVEAMQDAMPRCGDGKLLAFCRSGTRSTLAWALASRARRWGARAKSSSEAPAGSRRRSRSDRAILLYSATRERRRRPRFRPGAAARPSIALRCGKRPKRSITS